MSGHAKGENTQRKGDYVPKSFWVGGSDDIYESKWVSE
jgi:hypothetical protein